MIPLLDVLSTQYPDSSKRTLRQWIKFERVLVDGKVFTEKMVPKDAKIELAKKQLAPVDILFEDRHFIAVDKPANLLSVPAARGGTSCLELLRVHYRNPEIYAAHRLDQEASGVLLFVKGMKMREIMAEKFGQHDLVREYHAIVEGKTAPEGTWSFPLEELETYDVVVKPDGRPSETHFKRIRATARFSHLHIKLETGRKHQIRVHTSHVGHPIIGDRRYGSLSNPIKRLGLHAKRLAFSHPSTNKWIEITSPLPRAFEGLGANL